jgi:hypothetical protein
MPGLVPGIHELRQAKVSKTWMARSSPAMTRPIIGHDRYPSNGLGIANV